MVHKILCLDDEPSNNEAINRLLRKKYEVITFDEPLKAVEALKLHQFAIILSDQKMPEMSGVEFLKISQQQQPEALRILVTGYSDLETVINAINQGEIYRYIAKPWDAQDFLQTIDLAIDAYLSRQKIKQKNQELLTALEKLSQLDQSKADFMSIINHELKTPLTSIISFTDLLSEEKLNQDQKKYLSRIQQNASRLKELVDDTLLITNLNLGKGITHNDKFNLMDKTKSKINDLKSKYSEKSIEVAMENLDQSFNISEKLMVKILTELIDNLFKYTKDNSKAKIKGHPMENNFFAIEFSNSYEGAVIENPETLLVPFKKSEKSKNHSKGSGLGLSMVKAICEHWGGSVSIQVDKNQFILKTIIPLVG